MQKVQTALLPFHLHRKTVEVPEGLSLFKMVDYLIPLKSSAIDVVATINGEVIPKEHWKSVIPKQTALVGINVIPMKSGGKKNPLATILSIAIMVAAPYAAAAAAGVAAGTAVSAMTLSQALVYGAVRIGLGLVGYLATSMLSSVPSQKGSNTQTSIAESTTQFIEGSTNQILKYGVVPINLGVNRVFPPQAALPYTETADNKQFVRQLFTYGYGKVIVDQRRFGETDVSAFIGVEMQDKLDADLDDGTGIYANTVEQEGFSVAINNSSGYIIRTTDDDVDEAELDITFAQGLTAFSNETGNRVTVTVDFELTYSPAGLNQWTTGEAGKTFSSQIITLPTPAYQKNDFLNYMNNAGIISVNISNGQAYVQPYTDGSSVPTMPEGYVRIARYVATGTQNISGLMEWAITTLVDDRDASTPSIISDNMSFIPTITDDLEITLSGGTIAPTYIRISDATSQALRIPKRFVFPTRGRYDLRIKRLTSDNIGNDRVRDAATLTAIRSYRHAPPVTFPDISGTAMRIQGTDQINGSVDRYNVILSTIVLSYDAEFDIWQEAVSSNPADLYRHVLQSPAFKKALPDNRINLEKLKEWHAYCLANNFTYNRNIDFDGSIDDVLNDICAAGMATVHKVDGNYSVIIDNERPEIKGIVTPRNSWGYSGNINYPEIPHALRVEFRNKDKGYNIDERLVFADGYSQYGEVPGTVAADLYERLQFLSCTNSDLAYYYGRRYFATALLQCETHKFSMDWEQLNFNRGDKISFVNDVILVGVGSGRIKSVVYSVDEPDLVTGFVLDDSVNIPNTNSFGVRIRHINEDNDDFTYQYYPLATLVGETNTFNFATPIDSTISVVPEEGSLCTFTEFGKELELIILEISGNADQSAKIVAVNYAPERFTAADGPIPTFNSNITVPVELLPPNSPVLAGAIQSDESVMSRNSDGSFTGRMVIPLINSNEPSVDVAVIGRRSGATQFSRVDTLNTSPTNLIITGLEDGAKYDFEIRYQRKIGMNLSSLPLILNSVTYVGASALPRDVLGFDFSGVNGVGIFNWIANTDIDIHHYVMKFSRLTTGALWGNAQVIDDNIFTNQYSMPIQQGTYMIKAVDILGNESANAAVIVSQDEGANNNQVAFLQEQTTFPGTKVNCHVSGGQLFLSDPSMQGIYYFDNGVSLGDIYQSTLSSAIIAQGSNYFRVRGNPSIRALASLRGVGAKIRDALSIRAMSSVRGIDPSNWNVVLEMRTSQDNGGSWSDWETFVSGSEVFSDIEFRLLLNSFDPFTSPRVDLLEVTVDMPDRTQAEEGLSCPPTGLNVQYTPPFMNSPAVNITIQDAATDDRLEYVIKDNEQFTIKVWNATLAAYQTRIIDYNSTGYGRII